jgi:enoyl-CoA hydratase/3-hydroxyacyl-CoA dehydrogenase
MKTVLVVGAGTMGHGIAEVCALSGYRVILVDVNENILSNAIARITWSLKKLEEKGKIDAEEILRRIETSQSLEEVAPKADFVIEAVVENTEVKQEVFRILDERCKEECVLSTNTSTIPITDIAKATRRKEKIVGLHFFNLPTLIRLVEIIRGKRTSNETIEEARKFAESIGMDYVMVEKDVPGFLINRINVRVFVEALRLLEKFKQEEIDAAIRYRLGLPMGIFEVVDFSGVDTVYNVLREVNRRGLSVEIPDILERMVEDNALGMKTGKGFYTYKSFYDRAKIPKKFAYRVNPLQILAPGINEAAWLIRNGVASREDVDKASVKGMAYPKGILRIADSYGIDKVVGILKSRKNLTGLDEYDLDPLLGKMLAEGKLGKKSGEGFYTYNFEKVDFGVVSYEKRHDYALVTMRRPEKLNALNEEMWVGLNQAFKKAEEDEEIRAVILAAEGRAFCAGDDIAVMGSWKDLKDGMDFFEKIALPLVSTLANYEKPLISLVNGNAFGGGMELNLLFDVVIASDRATFSVPEGLIGAMPPIASTLGYFLFGRRIARYLLTGDVMDAEEARELGIVDIVVPHKMLEDVGIEFIDGISRVAPLSARAIKRSMNAVRDSIRISMDVAAREIELLIPTKDFAEGMRAFIAKRRPEWRGR